MNDLIKMKNEITKILKDINIKYEYPSHWSVFSQGTIVHIDIYEAESTEAILKLKGRHNHVLNALKGWYNSLGKYGV